MIAGWLGCQLRSLRRYEALYQKLGFGVVTRIATPKMVVQASTAQPLIPLVCKEWPTLKKQEYHSGTPETMQELAWDTLRQIHVSQCSVVVMHVFSNGGGFLWEQIRDILHNNKNRNRNLAIIQSKIVGSVFDSSPAKYSPTRQNTLFDALQHCTWKERMGAYVQVATQLATYSLGEREQRAADYFDSMRNDPSNMRQLYLCSKNDPLTPFVPLEELVRHRQQMFGNDRIPLCKWESSPHCCHLLQHPVEYEAAVTAFVETCLQGDTKTQSKL